MPEILPIAALYQSDTRLLVGLAMFVLFVAVTPRPAPRPVAAVALGAIVVIWDFGATLIWGTGGSTKVRFDFALSGTVGSWAVLASAIVGTVAAAAALRAWAHGKQSLGVTFSGTFLVAFAFWSCAVRYSPVIAVTGLLVGAAALGWAATAQPGEQKQTVQRRSDNSQIEKLSLVLPVRVLLPLLSGLIFYACLRWGPKSWADPQCGATLGIPTFFAAIGISAVGGGAISRIAGRRTEAVVAATLLTGVLAAAVCVVAFLLWFGQNHCGE